MNTYFENERSFSSNRGIIEAYLGQDVKPVGSFQKLFETILSWLAACVAFLSCVAVRRVIKTFGVAVSLVGFIGIVGAIEHGTIGIGTGLIIGSILLVIELLCLRPRAHRG